MPENSILMMDNAKIHHVLGIFLIEYSGFRILLFTIYWQEFSEERITVLRKAKLLNDIQYIKLKQRKDYKKRKNRSEDESQTQDEYLLSGNNMVEENLDTTDINKLYVDKETIKKLERTKKKEYDLMQKIKKQLDMDEISDILNLKTYSEFASFKYFISQCSIEEIGTLNLLIRDAINKENISFPSFFDKWSHQTEKEAFVGNLFFPIQLEEPHDPITHCFYHLSVIKLLSVSLRYQNPL
eukprot:gene11974-5375_t